MLGKDGDCSRGRSERCCRPSSGWGVRVTGLQACTLHSPIFFFLLLIFFYYFLNIYMYFLQPRAGLRGLLRSQREQDGARRAVLEGGREGGCQQPGCSTPAILNLLLAAAFKPEAGFFFLFLFFFFVHSAEFTVFVLLYKIYLKNSF